MEETIEVFLSYAHDDEALRDELLKHLASLKQEGLISIWHDGEISAGTDWQKAIDRHLNAAPLILLLISPAFIDSERCYNLEMQRAVERHNTGEACVIPIILCPTDWHDAPFAKLQELPPDDKPVTSWSDRNAAFLAVAKGIRKVIKERLSTAESLVEVAKRLPRGATERLPNIPESAREIAKSVIIFLEDRRVLYDPYNIQVAPFCVASVETIRRFLTKLLSAWPSFDDLPPPDDLQSNLRAMRSACRKFMGKVVISPAGSRPEFNFYSPQLIEALEELRATFRQQIGILVARYHITDIDENLASILPTPHEKRNE